MKLRNVNYGRTTVWNSSFLLMSPALSPKFFLLSHLRENIQCLRLVLQTYCLFLNISQNSIIHKRSCGGRGFGLGLTSKECMNLKIFVKDKPRWYDNYGSGSGHYPILTFPNTACMKTRIGKIFVIHFCFWSKRAPLYKWLQL